MAGGRRQLRRPRSSGPYHGGHLPRRVFGPGFDYPTLWSPDRPTQRLLSSALEYLNTVLADVGCTISASGFIGLGIDEVVATGDTVFIKYRNIGGPIPEYPNGYDSFGLDVVHMDPAGSGLIVGYDQWFDGIQTEAYADACTAAPLTGRRLGEGNAYKGPALKTLLGTAHKGSGPA